MHTCQCEGLEMGQWCPVKGGGWCPLNRRFTACVHNSV